MVRNYVYVSYGISCWIQHLERQNRQNAPKGSKRYSVPEIKDRQCLQPSPQPITVASTEICPTSAVISSWALTAATKVSLSLWGRFWKALTGLSFSVKASALPVWSAWDHSGRSWQSPRSLLRKSTLHCGHKKLILFRKSYRREKPNGTKLCLCFLRN